MAIKAMSRELARSIGIAFGVGPTALVFLIGSFWSLPAGLYAASVWTGIYLAWNVGIVKQQEWQVVERFGQFYEVKLRGLRFYCMLGLVDTIRVDGTLLERKKAIFEDLSTDSKLEEIDFTNGSAPIEAYMWYKNGRPGGNDEQIKEDIVAYAYTNEDPEARVVQITEDRLRPKFQELDVDKASETRADLVNGVKDDIRRELEPYGLYFSKEPPIVIADIGLTDEEKKLRQERMRGQTTADEIASESDGYRRGIEAIMYRIVKNPDETTQQVDVCDFETAAKIWREQQTRKMFEKTGSRITIIGKSAASVVKTFNINEEEGE